MTWDLRQPKSLLKSIYIHNVGRSDLTFLYQSPSQSFRVSLLNWSNPSFFAWVEEIDRACVIFQVSPVILGKSRMNFVTFIMNLMLRWWSLTTLPCSNRLLAFNFFFQFWFSFPGFWREHWQAYNHMSPCAGHHFSQRTLCVNPRALRGNCWLSVLVTSGW